MLLAELPSWLTDAGTYAGVFAALAVAVSIVFKAKWVRWVWRHLVSTPATQWLEQVVSSQIQPVVEEQRRVSDQLIAHMSSEEQERVGMESWRAEIRADIGELKENASATKLSVRRLHRRVDWATVALLDATPEVRHHPRVVVTTPIMFDASTEGEWFQRAAGQDLTGDVVIDMAETVFMDSSGIGALLKLVGLVDEGDGFVRVLNAAPQPRRALEITALGDYLQLP